MFPTAPRHDQMHLFETIDCPAGATAATGTVTHSLLLRDRVSPLRRHRGGVAIDVLRRCRPLRPQSSRWPGATGSGARHGQDRRLSGGTSCASPGSWAASPSSPAHSAWSQPDRIWSQRRRWRQHGLRPCPHRG